MPSVNTNIIKSKNSFRKYSGEFIGKAGSKCAQKCGPILSIYQLAAIVLIWKPRSKATPG